MNVTLVTSPHTRHPMVLQNDFEPSQSSMLTFIPIGLLSLISSLRASLALEPELYDLNRRILDATLLVGSSFYKDTAAALCHTEPHVVGFMTENESYHHVLQICREVKRLNPDCKIVLGGPHASAVAPATLKSWNCIDFIVKGEGEITFPRLVESCMKPSQAPVPGVWSRSPTGEVIFGGERPLVQDLDLLPYPAYDLYRPDSEEEIYFEVGRGCPFQCTFCSTAAFWQRRNRVKSPERIQAELEYVCALYGTRRFHFTHDLFTANRSWVRKVCETLIRAGVPVRWTCSSRTDTVDRDLLRLMADAGCTAIYFGLESGSSRVLADIKKRIHLDESFEKLRTCLDVGIAANVGFIGGFPSENLQTLGETFDAYGAALRMGCAPVYIFQFTPFQDSSIMGQLGERNCTGHFVDLPLGRKLDTSNRTLIRSDEVVFGAYHRPRQSNGIPEELIDAIEEYATLVSAAPSCTVEIASRCGGMLELYRRWVRWIGGLNKARATPEHRRYFGSPVQFLRFLMQEADALEDCPPGLRSLLRVLKTSQEVAAREQLRVATTMANYRTGLAPAEWVPLTLSTRLELRDVVERLELPENIEGLMSAKPPERLPLPQASPMYLLWQRVGPGQVRLLSVSEFTYHAAGELQRSTKEAASVLESWSTNTGREDRRDKDDLFVLVDELREAIQAGIVRAVNEP